MDPPHAPPATAGDARRDGCRQRHCPHRETGVGTDPNNRTPRTILIYGLVSKAEHGGRRQALPRLLPRQPRPDQSAGTYSSKRDADKAWQRAEAKLAEGRLSDPQRRRQTSAATSPRNGYPSRHGGDHAEAYTYQIGKHILPWFGPMRMNEIMPAHVREWVTDLQGKGVSPASIQKVRFILSAIFTAALDDVTFLHPCKGVNTPTVPRKPLKIITPEQFDAIYDALPDAASRLLVETDIETGLRWGELTEFRVKDLDPVTRILTISRTVVQVDPKFHPLSQRFLVKDYPKDKEDRRLKVSKQLAAKLGAHITDGGLGADDLLFTMRRPSPPPPGSGRCRTRRPWGSPSRMPTVASTGTGP